MVFYIAGDRRPDINTESLLDDVCMNALEHAKSKYKSASTRATDQQQQQASLSVRDVRLTQSGTVVQLPSNPSLTIEPTVLSVNSKSHEAHVENIRYEHSKVSEMQSRPQRAL